MSDCIAFFLYRRLHLKLELPYYLEPRYIERTDDSDDDNDNGIGCLQT